MVLADKQPAVFPSNPQATQPPRLLDREAMRARYDSLRNEETYVAWIRRFILVHNQRHPAEMGEREINHQPDLREGMGRIYLPEALARKYTAADREWGWQFVFPAAKHPVGLGCIVPSKPEGRIGKNPTECLDDKPLQAKRPRK